MTTTARSRRRTQPRDARGRFARCSTPRTTTRTGIAAGCVSSAGGAHAWVSSLREPAARWAAPLGLALTVMLGVGAATLATFNRLRGGRT